MTERNESTKARWGAFLLGTASAASMMTAAPAMAQTDDETPAEQVDEIVVKGIRQSLQGAQDVKQQADTVVDAITAEDIGALPDRSVTEALQRVPGVQISRFAAADDPDHFSIEGQGVLIRGLTFVRSELNGRDTFSANNGRALSFADVPAELLGGVTVYKNQTADLIEGGIAGSINLITRKPFDRDGQVFAGSIDANYGDFRERWTPSFSGLYSNTFDTDLGRFGFLVNGVYSELKTRSDGTQISSFQPRDSIQIDGDGTRFGEDGDGVTYFVPEGTAIRSQDYDRERIGYGGSVQWEDNSETFLATAEFLRSEATTQWGERVSEIATDNVGNDTFFFVPGTEFGFDEDNLFTNGTISAPTGWRGDQNDGDATAPIYGLQSNNTRRGVDQEYVTQDASFNLKITPSERWAFNLDYQFIDSTVENVDFTLWGSTFQDVRIDISGDVPDIEYLPPNVTPGFNPNSGIELNCDNDDPDGATINTCPRYASTFAELSDPQYSFWRAAMDHFEDSEGQEHAFRADAEYDFLDDLGPLRSVRVGARWAERDQTTRFSTYNWGVLSEIWGNGGPVWMDEAPGGVSTIAPHNWDNFQRDEVTRPPAFPYTMFDPAQDYAAAADFADSVVDQWLRNGGNENPDPVNGDGWVRLAQRNGVVDGTPYLPGEIADVVEENIAAYIKVSYGFDSLGDTGMPLDGNFGLRWFQTDLAATGAYQFRDATGEGLLPSTPLFPDGAGANQCVPDAEQDPEVFVPPAFCNLSDDEERAVRAFADGTLRPQDISNEYDQFLPSFNARLGVTDELQVRFAYSKSISRPDVGLLRPNFTFTPITDDDPRTVGPDPTPGGQGFFGFGAEGGNPLLEPVKSDNFDLSLEWYFDDVGSLTVSGFYKEIEDIIVSGQGIAAFTNNGVTQDDVFLRQPTNSDQTGTIQGFEVAYQQFYDFLPAPFDGIGVQATYTFIDSEGVQSSGVNATSASPAENEAVVDLSQFPLQGLSKHNANVALIYEKDKVSTRLVYNWRDEYLVTGRDVITPFYPIFQNASGQLDGSFFYEVSDNIKIGVQGANLLNEITETTSFIPNSGGLKGARSFFQNDRRVTASARFSF